MEFRKALHVAASSMNTMTMFKNGKPQRSPLQRLALLVEDATWEAPEALRGARGEEVLAKVAETFPVLDPVMLLRKRDLSLIDCLDRAAQNYWSLDRDYKDIESAVARAIFGFKDLARERFLDGLKNPAAADADLSIHTVLSSLREVAQADASLSLPTKGHWSFLRECPHGYRISRFPDDATFQEAFHEQSAYLAGVAIAQTLWDDVASSVPLPGEDFKLMTDAEMHERVEACREILGSGDPRSARHTVAELITLGRNAHLRVEPVIEAAEHTKTHGFFGQGKSMSADALEASLQGTGAIAPAAADWQGQQDYLRRVTASKVIDHLTFQIEMREMTRRHGGHGAEPAL